MTALKSEISFFKGKVYEIQIPPKKCSWAAIMQCTLEEAG